MVQKLRALDTTHCRDITHCSGANVSTQAMEAFQGVSLKSIPLSKHSIQLPSQSIFSMCVYAKERDAVIGYTVHKHREMTLLCAKNKSLLNSTDFSVCVWGGGQKKIKSTVYHN